MTVAEREARAWREYKDWAAGADPSQYVATEALAWWRLQDELIAIRTPAGTFSTELAIFTPEGGLDIAFEACPDFLDEGEGGATT